MAATAGRESGSGSWSAPSTVSAAVSAHLRQLCLREFPCGTGSWVRRGDQAAGREGAAGAEQPRCGRELGGLGVCDGLGGGWPWGTPGPQLEARNWALRAVW